MCIDSVADPESIYRKEGGGSLIFSPSWTNYCNHTPFPPGKSWLNCRVLTSMLKKNLLVNFLLLVTQVPSIPITLQEVISKLLGENLIAVGACVCARLDFEWNWNSASYWLIRVRSLTCPKKVAFTSMKFRNLVWTRVDVILFTPLD